MVLCVGCLGRLGAVGLRTSRPVLGASQLRNLSTVGLQRSRFIVPQNELRNLQFRSGPRSFWSWSKPTSAPPPTPAQAATEESAPASTAVPETPVPAEASAGIDAASVAPTPDAALPPVTIPTEGLPVDLASIPPLNYGDLAALGLADWTPAGICRWTMELINVSTGMPWFWTIIATTVLSRVVLFPFTVKQMQSTAALAPYQPDIMAIQEELKVAQNRRDMLAMQRAALKQKVLYEKAGVSVPGMALAPFIQLPVTLGLFFGVKTLCDLPVEQLKWSGVPFLSDLTALDPTWTLPIVATVLMNVQISVTMRDLVGQTPQMGHLMNFLRLLTTASVFVLANLPSGVILYILTSIVTMTAQSLFLRQAAVRRVLGIPLIPKHLHTQPPSMRESAQYARKWWKNKMTEARQAEKASRKR